MRKLAFILILVLSISLITFKAFTGDLEPSKPPGPTMHSLDEIYNQIVQNAMPRYEYKYVRDIGGIFGSETVTIHDGSGVVHSIIIGRVPGSDTQFLLEDGNNTICNLYLATSNPLVIPLNISYENSLKLYSNKQIMYMTFIYKPDN